MLPAVKAPGVRDMLPGMPSCYAAGRVIYSPAIACRENGTAVYAIWGTISDNRTGPDLWQRVPPGEYLAVTAARPRWTPAVRLGA